MYDEITIHLKGEILEDGRIYVTSPDLKGFHFLLEKDEDPFSTMRPTLEIFLKLMLKAELKEVKALPGMRDYKAQRLNIQDAFPFFPNTILAAMA
jgi:hypothetical protein